LMAGQSVGFVTREQSTSEILEELVDQALAVLVARDKRGQAQPVISPRKLSGSQDARE
jgi:hypothetical protein